MAGNSYRDESLSFTHSSSSPIQVSEADAFLTDHNSHIGSASGSFQNDGILANGESGSGSNSEAEFGFGRPEFRQFPLVGTVQIYERHVFLCYKNPQVWPPHIEAAEFDRLPRLLSAALMARKGEMKKKTRLTICEGHDGTETSNGDVLIFPDMIRYRRLTHFDVDTFVEEVLVKDTEWLPGTPEMLYGSFIFICCHGSRDRRCGVCGPALVARFREEVDVRKLQHQVSISPCSHIGGHKYAGNVIIFGRKSNCHEVTGHWYGYVCPEDVPILIEQHIVKGEVVDRLWRGQMGLSEEDQIKAHEFRLQLSREARRENNGNTGRSIENVQCYLSGCCLESKTSSCYQNQGQKDKNESTQTRRADGKKIEKAKKESKNPFNKNVSTRRTCPMPTWFETWEREDTYTALALLGAAVSVSIAYSFSKQLS